METPLHTIIETPGYLRQAKVEGMSVEEMAEAARIIAENPSAGDLIPGSGGCRKVRVPGRGKGKSGGYRVVTYYANARVPVFLLAVLNKGADENFTDLQVAAMAKATKTLVESLGPRAQAG